MSKQENSAVYQHELQNRALHLWWTVVCKHLNLKSYFYKPLSDQHGHVWEQQEAESQFKLQHHCQQDQGHWSNHGPKKRVLDTWREVIHQMFTASKSAFTIIAIILHAYILDSNVKSRKNLQCKIKTSKANIVFILISIKHNLNINLNHKKI